MAETAKGGPFPEMLDGEPRVLLKYMLIPMLT
jgi:hypothetical protein